MLARLQRAPFATAAAAPGSSDGKMTELYMRAVEPPPRKVPPPTAEEVAAWGEVSRRYVRLMWRRDRVQSRDLHRKVQLKWAALHALPTAELRRDALGVTGHVPLELRIAQLTPPSTGFHGPEEAAKERARQAVAAREAARAEEERLRKGLLDSGASSALGRKAKAGAKVVAPKAGGAFGSALGSKKGRFNSEEEDE